MQVFNTPTYYEEGLFKEITFNKSELNNIFSNNLEIIPSPGEGKFIDITHCRVFVKSDGTPFANSGQAFGLRPVGGGSGDYTFQINLGGITEGIVNPLAASPAGSDINQFPLNTGVELAANGPITGGGTNGTITFYIKYDIFVA